MLLAAVTVPTAYRFSRSIVLKLNTHFKQIAGRRSDQAHLWTYSVQNVGELRLLRRAAGQRDLKRTSRGISDLLIGYAWEQKEAGERHDDVPVDITVSSVNI
jgi:hypothetical protein